MSDNYKRCPCGTVIDDAQTHCSDECADMPALKAELARLRDELEKAKAEAEKAREELKEAKDWLRVRTDSKRMAEDAYESVRAELAALRVAAAKKDEALKLSRAWGEEHGFCEHYERDPQCDGCEVEAETEAALSSPTDAEYGRRVLDSLNLALRIGREVLRWSDAENNDGFPHDTRLALIEMCEKITALAAIDEEKEVSKP